METSAISPSGGVIAAMTLDLHYAKHLEALCHPVCLAILNYMVCKLVSNTWKCIATGCRCPWNIIHDWTSRSSPL